MRAAVTLLVLALAPLLRTRAEVVHLLEDFGLLESDVAGAAVASARRRAAAGAAAHLVGAARAQVVPPDEQHARRGLSAHIAPAAGRVRSLPHQFTRATTLYHAHWLAVSEMCQSPANGAPGSSPS